VDEKRPMRHAIEVRHESFETKEFVAMAKKYDVAIVVADTAGKWPLIEKVTSDFMYVRLHGDEEIYVSGYTDKALDAWAKKVKAWGKRGDVYVYFDNDVKVRAPVDAMGLAKRLGLKDRQNEIPDVAPGKETARKSWPAVKKKETGKLQRKR
jgi:uncharacterized protein YecE (DUF72 family)